MSGGGGEEGTTLEFTPTWVVALVCTVIVAISLGVERLLHYGGKYLKKTDQQPLFQALQKIKEELMLLGFISLLLTVFQNRIVKICVAEDIMKHLLPCSLPSESASSGEEGVHASPETEAHHRRLLEEEASSGYCSAKDKVPLLSLEATHHLHIFIFVLAIVHVTFSVLTVVFGGIRIRQWKRWEDSTAKDNYRAEHVLKPKITHVHQHDFIKKRFLGVGKRTVILGPLHSFLKQFYGSVTKSDYLALRHGFIMTHCRGNPKFNFHKYMIRALEADFKKVVGISWYLWIFVVVFLLLNINGWHTYFWIAFFPFVLLLAVGTKLEHIISQLANEVAEKHVAVEGELVVKPSDDHFWFGRPRIVLFLIHFILFQNAFEIAFFFWIWVQYGFDSCIMGRVVYIVPRLIIGVFIQLLCSYSTLPLYAIVTQMGTYFKKSIFEEHVQVGILGWAEKAKKNHGGGGGGGGGGLKGALGAAAAKGKNSSTSDDSSGHVHKGGLKGAFSAASAKGNTPSTTDDSSDHVQMGDLGNNEPRRPDV